MKRKSACFWRTERREREREEREGERERGEEGEGKNNGFNVEL